MVDPLHDDGTKNVFSGATCSLKYTLILLKPCVQLGVLTKVKAPYLPKKVLFGIISGSLSCIYIGIFKGDPEEQTKELLRVLDVNVCKIC